MKDAVVTIRMKEQLSLKRELEYTATNIKKLERAVIGFRHDMIRLLTSPNNQKLIDELGVIKNFGAKEDFKISDIDVFLIEVSMGIAYYGFSYKGEDVIDIGFSFDPFGLVGEGDSSIIHFFNNDNMITISLGHIFKRDLDAIPDSTYNLMMYAMLQCIFGNNIFSSIKGYKFCPTQMLSNKDAKFFIINKNNTMNPAAQVSFDDFDKCVNTVPQVTGLTSYINNNNPVHLYNIKQNQFLQQPVNNNNSLETIIGKVGSEFNMNMPIKGDIETIVANGLNVMRDSLIKLISDGNQGCDKNQIIECANRLFSEVEGII